MIGCSKPLIKSKVERKILNLKCQESTITTDNLNLKEQAVFALKMTSKMMKKALLILLLKCKSSS